MSFISNNACKGVLVRSRRTVHDSRDGASNVAMPGGGELTIRGFLKTLTHPGRGVGSRLSDLFRVGDTVLVCEVQDTGTGIPASPSGGLLGVGNPIAAAGMMKCAEIYWQLQGQAGPRQVKREVRRGLAQAWGDLMQVGTVVIMGK